MSSLIEFRELELFQEVLADVADSYPLECEKALNTIGNKLKRELIAKTPDGKDFSQIEDRKIRRKRESKKMKKRWHKKLERRSGGDLKLNIWNSNPAVGLVERGHRIVDSRGREKGFVQGRHFIRSTALMAETNIIPETVEKLYRKISRRVERESR